MAEQMPSEQQEAPQETSGKAIASLVLGIVGFMCIVPAILAIVFGFIAKREIDESGGALGGRGMAIAGIVLGFAWIAIGLILVVVQVLIIGGAAAAQGM